MDTIIDVTCAIIFHEGKVLVTQRGPGMSMPGKWEFPGGKIEAGETAEACIVREISEEIGIKIILRKRLPDFFHNYNNLQINLIPFLAGYLSGEIILAEHQQFMWVDKKELSSFDWAEADTGIVKLLISNSFYWT